MIEENKKTILVQIQVPSETVKKLKQICIDNDKDSHRELAVRLLNEAVDNKEIIQNVIKKWKI